MASVLFKVRLNFVFRLEAITPSYTKITTPFKLTRSLKGRGVETAGNSSGNARIFTVRRLGADKDLEPTDGASRWAWHQYEFRIAYPTAIGDEDDLSEMMDTDRNDIHFALYLKSSFTGITGASSAATGLVLRTRLEDRLDDEGAVWVQTYRYNCQVREDL